MEDAWWLLLCFWHHESPCESLSPLLDSPHQSPDIAGTPGAGPVLSEAIRDVSAPAELSAQYSRRSGHSQHCGELRDSLGNRQGSEKKYCRFKPPSFVITQQ